MHSFRPSPSGFPDYGRVLGYICLLWIGIFILDPSRLISGLEALSDDMPVAERMAESVADVADTLGLTAFADAQRSVVAALTTETRWGTTEQNSPQTAFGSSGVSPIPAPGSGAILALAKQAGMPPEIYFIGPRNATLPDVEEASLDFIAAMDMYDEMQFRIPLASGGTLRPLVNATVLLGRNGTVLLTTVEDARLLPVIAGEGKQVIILTGDSMMMDGLGPALMRHMRKRPDVAIYREAVYSTGLSRPDYFNWPEHMEKLVKKYTPDIVVICIGANDVQDIVDDKKKRHHPGQETWIAHYQQRAQSLVDAAQTAGAQVVWVGLPVMGNSKISKHVGTISTIQSSVCSNSTSKVFVDTSEVLVDEKGAYTTFLKLDDGSMARIRAKDQIHLTEVGGRLIADKVIPVIEDLLPPAPPEGSVQAAAVSNSPAQPPQVKSQPSVQANATSAAKKNGVKQAAQAAQKKKQRGEPAKATVQTPAAAAKKVQPSSHSDKSAEKTKNVVTGQSSAKKSPAAGSKGNVRPLVLESMPTR